MSISILEDKIIIVRKDHECFLTGEVILKGSKARYIKQVDNGDFYDMYISLAADKFLETNRKLLENAEGTFEENCIVDEMPDEWEEFRRQGGLT